MQVTNNIDEAASSYNATGRLSACARDEIQCHNGDCLPMDSRCDAAFECSANEDEDGCELLATPGNLVFLTKKTRLDMAVDVVVERIIDIDGKNGIFRAKFEIRLAWTDKRLGFHNLQQERLVNKMSNESLQRIWKPEYHLKDLEVRYRNTHSPAQESSRYKLSF